jgi:RHS repeat-associated protein
VQNYTYSYDRYGNRLTQTPLQSGYTFDPTINPANNHITTSGFTYDAAGNMTNDTVHSYTYDAEGNLLAVDGGSTAVYVYDALNRRVHVQTASATNEYAYDYAGRRISTWLSPNNYGSEGRIYWDSQQIGYRSTDGTTYFDHQDTLGTERIRTNYGGTAGSTYLSLPWGDGYTATVNTSGADQDNLHFAGLEHDEESGTEHAQFRNYASAQGRWLAPDPYMGSYDLMNPQSMNRYAYVLNNPTSSVDPGGLMVCQAIPCGSGGQSGGGDDGNGPSYYVDGIEVSGSVASWYLSLGGGQQIQVSIGYSATGTTGYYFQTGVDLINLSVDPFGFFNGLGSSSASPAVAFTDQVIAPNNSAAGSAVPQPIQQLGSWQGDTVPKPLQSRH